MEHVLKGSPRVDIHLSINPEFELRLVSVSIDKTTPVMGECSVWEIGHAWFTILSEAGEISTGSLLLVERSMEAGVGRKGWRLAVQPRPVLATLAETMEKLVLAEAEEQISRSVGGLVSD